MPIDPGCDALRFNSHLHAHGVSMNMHTSQTKVQQCPEAHIFWIVMYKFGICFDWNLVLVYMASPLTWLVMCKDKILQDISANHLLESIPQTACYLFQAVTDALHHLKKFCHFFRMMAQNERSSTLQGSIRRDFTDPHRAPES
jgi:hypothetical protein